MMPALKFCDDICNGSGRDGDMIRMSRVRREGTALQQY